MSTKAKQTSATEKPKQHLWFWQRSTPRRGPDFQHKTVVFQGWGYVTPRKTSMRSIRHLEERAKLTEGQIRDIEVGINPVYRGHPRDGSEHKAWKKRLREWTEARVKERRAAEAA